jgi:ethanolamine utilization microcompartment shell protein EutS
MLVEDYPSAISICDINRLHSSVYTGPACKIKSDVTEEIIDIDYVDGKIDKQAIADHCVANDGVVKQIYDQTGNGHHVVKTGGSDSQGKIYDGATQTFNEDANGDIYSVNWLNNYHIPSLGSPVPSTISAFLKARQGADAFPILSANLSNSIEAYYASAGSSSTVLDEGFGTGVKYAKDGVMFTGTTRDDLYTFAEDTSSFGLLQIMNLDLTGFTYNYLQFSYTNYDPKDLDIQASFIFTGDVEADQAGINNAIVDAYSGVALLRGEIKLSGVSIPDSIVNIMRATNPFDQSTHELVETVIADGNGVYTATLDTDTLYDYWASPVGFVSEFTGTITSVGGTGNVELTLPSDLSGLNIGGANNDLYVIKATGGAGSGNAVAVTGRTGNTITVAVNPGFTDTTVYDLGKAYFPGKLFSKTETA